MSDLSEERDFRLRDFWRLAVFVLVIGAAGGFFVWWSYWYQNPTRVFWSALANGLSTSNVTLRIRQEDSQLTLDEYIQLSLSPNLSAQGLTTLSRSGSTVVTQSISTPHTELVRYNKVATQGPNPEAHNFQKVLGLWTTIPSSNPNPLNHLYGQTMLGMVPLADLSSANVQNIVQTMKQTKAYQPDIAHVKKSVNDGHHVLLYSVKMPAYGRAKVLQLTAHDAGLPSAAQLNSNLYTESVTTALTAIFAIDPVSHELVSINYGDSQLLEDFQGYGVQKQLVLPTHPISETELQKHLQ